MVLIDDRLWSAIVLECADSDSGAMFVGAADKSYIFIEHAKHTDEDVCGQVGSREMSDVEGAIGIG